ncbi:ABC transporter substrate-binding protein [Frankia sp. CiP3]|uniref:ABC transporter substrate-binding protein n=1 Tax=Frankia sp. CiP3 TaxID=2880971 RepID=UPI001EF56F0A|nr:ABC transporter substrate-binding protein [Frankia sp. CiP3]
MRWSRTIPALLLGAAMLIITACGGGTSGATADSPAGTSLRVADQLTVLETPLRLAGQDKNLPYSVTYSNFVGGPPMLQAFQAGKLDVGWIADAPLIFAQAARQKVVGIAAYATTNGSQLLLAAPDRHITTWADLKGKSVGYQKGTSLESVLLLGLQSAGLSLKDVKPVDLAATQLVQALQAGEMDSVITSQPLDSAYLAKNPTAPQIPVPGNNLALRTNFLIASESALKDPAKAAAIGDYVARFVKAVNWENSHVPEVSKATYVDQYKLPQALGERLLTAAGPSAFFALPGDLLPAQQNLADLFAQAGEIPSKVDTAAEFTSLYNATVLAAQGSAVRSSAVPTRGSSS